MTGDPGSTARGTNGGTSGGGPTPGPNVSTGAQSGLSVAGLAGLGGVAGSFAIAGLSPAFVAAPVGTLFSKLAPGAIVTVAILVLGDLGQQVTLLGAAVAVAGGLAVLVAAGRAVGRQLDSLAVAVVLPTVGAWAVAVLLTGALVSSLGVAAGVAVVLAIADAAVVFGEAEGVNAGRRRVVGGVVAALGAGLVGTVLAPDRSARTGTRPSETEDGESSVAGPGDGVADGTVTLSGVDETAVVGLLEDARSKSLPVDDLEPLVSEEFYEVDINPVDPAVAADTWTLSVTGAVEEEFEVDYPTLRDMDHDHRFVTLRCVGEQLNGKKIDNALWTGVPVMDIVERANPKGEYVVLRAEDGYFEEFPVSALEDSLFAYGMNGKPLPEGHGYPVRALVPGHWGEINVKWLTEVEFSEEPVEGYWEQRGWHGTGPVNTVAKLHHVNHTGDAVTVAGHAYAGTRGVDIVEVSTDDGETWSTATLSEPLPGTDVWRQWSYSYEPPADNHEVVVRAVDGTGNRQPKEDASPYPSGASGWVSRTVDGRTTADSP
jgi:hypothetical protein